MAHACHPSTTKAEAAWLHGEFQSSMDSETLSPKQNNETDKNTEGPKVGPQLTGQFLF